LDVDRDGYGDPSQPREGCRLTDLADNGDDCDDSQALVNPAAIEKCDGIDNDCVGGVDDGLLFVPGDYASIEAVFELAEGDTHVCLEAGSYTLGDELDPSGRVLRFEGYGGPSSVELVLGARTLPAFKLGEWPAGELHLEGVRIGGLDVDHTPLNGALLQQADGVFTFTNAMVRDNEWTLHAGNRHIEGGLIRASGGETRLQDTVISSNTWTFEGDSQSPALILDGGLVGMAGPGALFLEGLEFHGNRVETDGEPSQAHVFGGLVYAPDGVQIYNSRAYGNTIAIESDRIAYVRGGLIHASGEVVAAGLEMDGNIISVSVSNGSAELYGLMYTPGGELELYDLSVHNNQSSAYCDVVCDAGGPLGLGYANGAITESSFHGNSLVSTTRQNTAYVHGGAIHSYGSVAFVGLDVRDNSLEVPAPLGGGIYASPRGRGFVRACDRCGKRAHCEHSQRLGWLRRAR